MKNGEQQIFDLEQAGDYLTRSSKYVRGLCYDQKIRFMREGRGPKAKYLIRREWLEEYLDRYSEVIEPIDGA